MKKNPYTSNAHILLIFTLFFGIIPFSIEGGFILSIIIFGIMLPITLNYYKHSRMWDKFNNEKLIDYDEYLKHYKKVTTDMNSRFIICEYHYKRYSMFKEKEDSNKFIEHSNYLIDQKYENIYYILGHAYFFGIIFNSSEIKSIYYLEKARNFGNNEARYLLSCIYLDNASSEFYDQSKGLNCLGEASYNNHAESQFKLAAFYEKNKNIEEAKKWYIEAYKNGIVDAKECISRLNLSINNDDSRIIFYNELYK